MVKSHLLCRFVRGLSSSQLELNNTGEGQRYLRTSDLLEDLAFTKFDERFCADPPGEAVYKREGQLALTIEGFNRPDGGSTVGVPCWKGEGLLNNHCVLVQPRTSGVDERFAQYAHATIGVIDLLQASAAGAIAASAGPALVHLRMPLPPIAEQRAIADFLADETARIDALIAARQRQLRLLANRERSLIESTLIASAQGIVPLRRLLSEPPQYGASESGEPGDGDVSRWKQSSW